MTLQTTDVTGECKVLPPPLAWVDGFIQSVQGAIGSGVKYDTSTTVNPLVFKIRIRFQEKVSGKNMMLIWNLFQGYAAKNDSVPQGKVAEGEFKLVAEIIIKRRLGPPRDRHPLE